MAQIGDVNHYDLLVIGGSAGSLEAILQLLPGLEAVRSLAVVLVLHRRGGESLLTSLLADKTTLLVKEAEEKEPVVPGTLYIAPADYHLLFETNKTISLDYSEKVNYSRPSIDVTFESAADVYGNRAIALLLSGANADGTEGLRKVTAAGGYAIVQDPATAVVAYMPQHAINHVYVDKVVPIASVSQVIQHLLQAE
jgi:two-component system chemotaxis response regulator CheB